MWRSGDGFTEEEGSRRDWYDKVSRSTRTGESGRTDWDGIRRREVTKTTGELNYPKSRSSNKVETSGVKRVNILPL